MTLLDIAHQRLHNQRLVGVPFATPASAVRALGAVQAQDYHGAKWAVGQRSKNCTDATVQAAFNKGHILRTHILRPTWHFVAPEDIRWIQELTAPRVHAFNAYYYRKVELEEPTLKKATAVIVRALEGGVHLTRAELQQALNNAGLAALSLRLGYILMYAELEALICSGPMKGKQHTYSLLAERAPQAKSLPREEALVKLTQAFFASHGPALVEDFAWWSSLSKADIKAGLAMAGLQSETLNGKTYWFGEWTQPKVPTPLVHLLPNYDEYLVAYKDRPSFFDDSHMPQVGTRDIAFANHILTLGGKLLGGWRRIPHKNSVTVETNYVRTLTAQQNKALQQAVDKFQAFLGQPVTVTRRTH